jgi:hypothetical protein
MVKMMQEITEKREDGNEEVRMKELMIAKRRKEKETTQHRMLPQP